MEWIHEGRQVQNFTVWFDAPRQLRNKIVRTFQMFNHTPRRCAIQATIGKGKGTANITNDIDGVMTREVKGNDVIVQSVIAGTAINDDVGGCIENRIRFTFPKYGKIRGDHVSDGPIITAEKLTSLFFQIIQAVFRTRLFNKVNPSVADRVPSLTFGADTHVVSEIKSPATFRANQEWAYSVKSLAPLRNLSFEGVMRHDLKPYVIE